MPRCRKHSKSQAKSESGGKCKYPHLIGTQNVQDLVLMTKTHWTHYNMQLSILSHCHHSNEPVSILLMLTHICHMHTSHMHGTPTTGPTVPHKTPHVWPHTLVRAVRSKLYSSIRSWTTSAWPSWAAKCSMVNPRLSVLWSRDCIFGARYWILLTWPPHAAQWRALCPSYMRETHNN